jgi:predicted lipid carrier protein YhbT
VRYTIVASPRKGRELANADETRQALHDLAARLDASAGTRGKLDFNRTLACRVSDLGTAFNARLTGGRLVDIADGDDPTAKITITSTSDDLIALVRGDLDVLKAVSARRLSINANPFDLLKLRKLL